jgi:hypothetical protein
MPGAERQQEMTMRRRNWLKATAASILGILSLDKTTKAALSGEKGQLEGMVYSENEDTHRRKFCRADTIEQFRDLGKELLPTATFIAMCLRTGDNTSEWITLHGDPLKDRLVWINPPNTSWCR